MGRGALVALLRPTAAGRRSSTVRFSDPRPETVPLFRSSGRLLQKAERCRLRGRCGSAESVELAKFGHPAHERQSIRELVKGASLGCAAKYGAKDDVATAGVPLLADTALPGSAYFAGGGNVVIF